MNKEQLRYFSVAYRTHNFAAAARLIPMSAQGFAKSIRSLEAELGVALFDRDENGMHIPTAYADELILFAQDFDANYLQLLKAFRQIEARERKEVLLGSSLGIMGFLGDNFLKDFQKKHGDISIRYSEMSDALCDKCLEDGTFPLAFTLAPYNSTFETIEVYSTPVCLWVNSNDPLSKKDSISIEDLDGASIALPGPDYKCYNAILDRCKEKEVQPRNILESSEMFWLYDFAYNNRGIAFSAGHLGRLPFFKSDEVKCIPLADVTWRFGISSAPQHKFSESEKIFYKFCLTYFAEHPQGV